MTEPAIQPVVTAAYRLEPFFDPATSSLSYLLHDRASGACAVVDAVLDYQADTGRTATTSANRLVARIQALGGHLQWILETHVHADHLSAASYLKQVLGGCIGIGAGVRQVQACFSQRFEQACDQTEGQPFDRLLDDGVTVQVGTLALRVLYTPGHTPACSTYLLELATAPLAFVGDTLFSPDYGTARCDFPGGDAHTLYRSIQRLLGLPPDTRLLLCHDYRPGGRALVWQTTVAEQRKANMHVGGGVTEAAFVAMRQARDATLPVPALMLPAVQVNLRAGQLPGADANGVRDARTPLDPPRDLP